MSLANPAELACLAEDGTTIDVIVETPKDLCVGFPPDALAPTA